MKITKKNPSPSTVKWVGICLNCKSEAEAEQHELNITYDRDGNFAWHACPVCSAGNNPAGYGGILFYPPKVSR